MAVSAERASKPVRAAAPLLIAALLAGPFSTHVYRTLGGTWGLFVGLFLLETLAAFTWSRGEPAWWLYRPVSLVIATLALIVAAPARSKRRTQDTAPSH